MSPLPFQPAESFQWRNVGPRRGGRSIACSGSTARPNEYYFGATGGGLWKTVNAGLDWFPVTDGQIRSSSVGAVAVAPSDPDVVYIGMGETELRGNVMQGDGVYGSTDGGKTWAHLGLEKTLAIARVRVDPRDPNRVYVAALGDPSGPTPDRGVFRSKDGGKTWEKVLYRSDRAGAVDLVLDPRNPDVLYAALWQVYRVPWRLWSGGRESGLFRSTDGGTTWVEISKNPGFPTGDLGKVGLAVSGADSNRLYAIVEAKMGGLYRSDDAGATWTHVNGNRDLWQRSFYFNRVVAHPKDKDTVFVLNYFIEKSTDGGKTFTQKIAGTHLDHHDLWIDSSNPLRMINAHDGGGSVTTDGGRSWSNTSYPTAQLYHVETTVDFRYHVVGSQQDNSSVAAPSAESDRFYAVGGGESGYIVPDRRDPSVFFAGATNVLSRLDRRTKQERDVQPYPRVVMGEPARDMPERWNWTYPIAQSPVDPRFLYVGSQHVWRTTDDGETWEKISPDLTRADASTLGETGGPIVLDQDGPEVYGTIFTIAPSRLERDTIWTGSDDGVVQVTRDGGKTWKNVTPRDMPDATRVSLIDASPHVAGGAYVAGKRNQMGDRRPYIWKTRDFGETWTRIDSNLPPGDFVHAVREDPAREGLLYAGTEHGVYVSFDDGGSWASLSLNLPDVQVPDLKVEAHDLVIATHGRSFWVLDNLAPLRQWKGLAPVKLYQPEGVYRRIHPAKIDFYLGESTKDARLEILDAKGAVVRALRLPAELRAGHHRMEWDLRYPGATVFPGMILESESPARGVWAPPARYQVRLSVGGASLVESFEVQRDPRLKDVITADLEEQFALASDVRDWTSAANEAVLRIRAMKRDPAAHRLHDALTEIESDLYQIQNQSPKDKIAFSIKLNDRLAGLLSSIQSADARPTSAQRRVARELHAELETHLGRLKALVEELR